MRRLRSSLALGFFREGIVAGLSGVVSPFSLFPLPRPSPVPATPAAAFAFFAVGLGVCDVALHRVPSTDHYVASHIDMLQPPTLIYYASQFPPLLLPVIG